MKDHSIAPQITLNNQQGTSLVSVLVGMGLVALITASVFHVIGTSMDLQRGIIARADFDDAMNQLKLLLKKEANCEGLLKDLRLDVRDTAVGRTQTLDLSRRTLPGSSERFPNMKFGSIRFDKDVQMELMVSLGTVSVFKMILLPISKGDTPIRPRPIFINMTMAGAGTNTRIDRCGSDLTDPMDIDGTIFYGTVGDQGVTVPESGPGEFYAFEFTVFDMLAPGYTGGRWATDGNGWIPRTANELSYKLSMFNARGGARIPLGQKNTPAPGIVNAYIGTIGGILSGNETAITYEGTLPSGFTGRARMRVDRAPYGGGASGRRYAIVLTKRRIGWNR